MSKLIGDENVIKAAKAVPAGGVASLINWDEIERIPELFDVRIAAVHFKPPTKTDSGDFEAVGNTGTYMVASELANRIADVRGISGLDFGEPMPIYQEIDWNRMTCQFDKPPMLVRYLVGYTAIKQGKVLKTDGSEPPCDSCVVSYNAWERVCSDKFSEEEKATDYYSPDKVKAYQDGRKYYEYSWFDKAENQTKTAKKNILYDTRAKRQAAFDDEMKFAQRKADTKARSLVVRVVCGMPTGYTAEQLKGGVFYFSRVVRSEFAIKSEHAARLAAYSHGIEDHSASRSLFGSAREEEPRDVTPAAPVETRNVTPQPSPVTPASAPVVTPPMVTPSPTVAELARAAAPEVPPAVKEVAVAVAPDAGSAPDQRAELIRVLKSYTADKLVPTASAVVTGKILVWLESTPKATEDKEFWPKAIKTLAAIEADIAEPMRISQGIRR